jgi:hypothetical protein
MTRFAPSVCIAALLVASAAAADPLGNPSTSGPLGNNPTPISFDPGFGPIYVSGQVTGLGLFQSNPQHEFPGDSSTTFDLTNAQVELQKTDGLIQFYVQAGLYSFPTVGLPYEKSTDNTTDTFGAVPVAYLKIAPTDNFSVEAGKLPTLIGAEYSFTFQNMNIERGMIWYQEPVVSRGVQVNYSTGPLALNVSWNDGYYSNRYNWASGLLTWTIDSANTLAVAAGGNVGKTDYSTFTAPYYLNNGDVYNLIYTYSSAPWVISPYVQYQRVDKSVGLGIVNSMDDWGLGLLATYTFDANWSLAGRVEYQTSSGGTVGQFPLPYGQGSKMWSFTATPTYQLGRYFIRAEGSYASLNDESFGYGKLLNKSDQFRGLLELGITF